MSPVYEELRTFSHHPGMLIDGPQIVTVNSGCTGNFGGPEEKNPKKCGKQICSNKFKKSKVLSDKDIISLEDTTHEYDVPSELPSANPTAKKNERKY